MEPKKPVRAKKQPEHIIQEAIVRKLKGLDWLVKETHGNIYQSGFPDVYAFHRLYGQRWIEVKNPKGYKFTPAQMEWFPKFSAVGCGIWILTADTDDEIKKLFLPPNWYQFLAIWKESPTSK